MSSTLLLGVSSCPLECYGRRLRIPCLHIVLVNKSVGSVSGKIIVRKEVQGLYILGLYKDEDSVSDRPFLVRSSYVTLLLDTIILTCTPRYRRLVLHY